MQDISFWLLNRLQYLFNDRKAVIQAVYFLLLKIFPSQWQEGKQSCKTFPSDCRIDYSTFSMTGKQSCKLFLSDFWKYSHHNDRKAVMQDISFWLLERLPFQWKENSHVRYFLRILSTMTETEHCLLDTQRRRSALTWKRTWMESSHTGGFNVTCLLQFSQSWHVTKCYHVINWKFCWFNFMTLRDITMMAHLKYGDIWYQLMMLWHFSWQNQVHPYLSILVYWLSYNRCPNTCDRIEEKLISG